MGWRVGLRVGWDTFGRADGVSHRSFLVENEGAELYAAVAGSGTPVLLIMGLSFTHEMWFRVLPALTREHRVILFDNRGMGRSSVPRGPYSIPLMARDSLAVLRAAGESSAHVIGASMGGMIAQELALRYPEAVRSLQLGCTSHGGLLSRWPDLGCLPKRGEWSAASRVERERSIRRLLYANTTPLERIEEDIQIRCGCTWTNKGFLNQLTGILMWSAYRRLPEIRVPTLVVHGDQDKLVPLANGRALARRIPGAEFQLVPNAAHVMTTDQPERCTEIMVRFLRAQLSAPPAIVQKT